MTNSTTNFLNYMTTVIESNKLAISIASKTLQFLLY